MAREHTLHTPSEFDPILRARHEGRRLLADGGLDLPEIARQLGNLLYEDRLRRVGGDLLQRCLEAVVHVCCTARQDGTDAILMRY